MRPQAIHRLCVSRRFDSAHAAKPVGWSPESVAIVIQQSMLGHQSALFLVKLLHLVRRGQVGFQQRGLTVLVKVGGGVGDGLGQIAAEPCRIDLVATARCRDDHTTRRRERAQKGAAGGSALTVSYTHLRAHETDSYLVCRLLLEKKK